MIDWLEFTLRTRGYSYKYKNTVIPKYILYERIKNRDDIDSIIDGRSNEYIRVNSDGWEDGVCYYYWTLNPITGKPCKEYTTVPSI